MIECISWLSAFFAFAAAVLWWLSAKVRIPDIRDNIDELVNDLNSSTRALRRQASLSGWGAYSAAAAAFFQGLVLLLPLLKERF
jgi:predicted MFS family arabinose efflux permease